MVVQPSLFSRTAHGGSICGTERGLLDSASEQALDAFRAARLAMPANATSVARDVSQLRALVRVSRSLGGPGTLQALFADLHQVARTLCITTQPISLSTGRTRLLAAQRFIRYTARAAAQDADDILQMLDRLLPSRPAVGWYDTGIIVAGTTVRRRSQAPTLSPADLNRLVAAAGRNKRSDLAIRDRALMALLCFTGTRAEELKQVRWEDIGRIIAAPGRMALAVHVRRGDQQVGLPLLGPAADALDALAQSCGVARQMLSGPIFRRTNRSDRPLSYRAARNVVRVACRAAGLPRLESSDLRAACANWLRLGGLTDHEIANALGIRRVHTIDNLLRRHAALDAQRLAREVLGHQGET